MSLFPPKKQKNGTLKAYSCLLIYFLVIVKMSESKKNFENESFCFLANRMRRFFGLATKLFYSVECLSFSGFFFSTIFWETLFLSFLKPPKTDLLVIQVLKKKAPTSRDEPVSMCNRQPSWRKYKMGKKKKTAKTCHTRNTWQIHVVL